MKLLSIVAVAAVGFSASSVFSDEVVVEIPSQQGSIVGTLETPEAERAPVVLMLHGFLSSRDELAVANTDEGVFARTARVLAENGIASLRIDFRGSGESSGAWEETTFSGQVSDALTAIDWLGSSDAVDGSRLAVLGWSQGGLVASHAAAASDAVDALVLWAAVVNPTSTYSALFGAEAMTSAYAAEAGDPVTLPLPWGGETTLNGAFFDEMPITSTAAALASFEGPLLGFVGTKDTLVAPQPASGEILLRYHAGEGDLRVLDMDHVFNVFSGPETLDQKMLPEIVDWLQAIW